MRVCVEKCGEMRKYAILTGAETCVILIPTEVAGQMPRSKQRMTPHIDAPTRRNDKIQRTDAPKKP